MTPSVLEEPSELDLVNTINALGGIVWRLNHDAAKGHFEQPIDAEIKTLLTQHDSAVAELKKRTGLADDGALREYFRTKLKEQDAMWDMQWAAICTPGAVFKSTDEKRTDLYETVRSYLASSGSSIDHPIVLARRQGQAYFITADGRDVTKLVKVDAPSVYTTRTSLEKGLIQAHEELDKRKASSRPRHQMHEFSSFDHTVFYHQGFSETFEVVEHYNLPNTEREDRNVVLLAHSHKRPVLVEMTRRDLPLMDIATTEPKYRHRDGLNLRR